jgi:quercetin dioxygenase-like cupin family protein
MKSKLIPAVAVAAVAAAVGGGTVLARTAATGFTGTTIARATYAPIDLRVHSVVPADPDTMAIPGRVWGAMLKTNGDSDLYVQSNTWQPGGSTGWHTHPGWSLIVVTSGAVTVYDGDDPSCTPHVYGAGQSFVDPGGGHVHLIRNESATQTATGVAVQLIPAGATRTQPVAAPGNCSF